MYCICRIHWGRRGSELWLDQLNVPPQPRLCACFKSIEVNSRDHWLHIKDSQLNFTSNRHRIRMHYCSLTDCLLSLCVSAQSRFTALMQEKVDLKERVEELEHRCIQLSGETDTIGNGRTLHGWGSAITANGMFSKSNSFGKSRCHFNIATAVHD